MDKNLVSEVQLSHSAVHPVRIKPIPSESFVRDLFMHCQIIACISYMGFTLVKLRANASPLGCYTQATYVTGFASLVLVFFKKKKEEKSKFTHLCYESSYTAWIWEMETIILHKRDKWFLTSTELYVSDFLMCEILAPYSTYSLPSLFYISDLLHWFSSRSGNLEPVPNQTAHCDLTPTVLCQKGKAADICWPLKDKMALCVTCQHA